MTQHRLNSVAETIEKYGAKWPKDLDALQIEMGCIRQGGKWKSKTGVECGAGLSRHYENMRNILWPDLEDHRWNSICRDEILKNKVTVLMGPGSSGKTHTAAWVHLCEYFCYPEDTCVLVSSTDMRGLKMRVWGEISSLWSQAVEKFDYLPGHMLDSACAITTDSLDDDEGSRNIRDFRKGVVGIPTMQGGRFVGLQKWIGIKQKRVRLVADEACFPAGTLVDTPFGRVPIQDIRPGMLVNNAIGSGRVVATSVRSKKQIALIKTKGGRTIKCTPEHPFFTNIGWINACHLNQKHYMVSTYEAMRILQSDVPSIHSAKQMHSMPNQAEDMRALQIPIPTQEIERARSVLLAEVQVRLDQSRELQKDVLVLWGGISREVPQFSVSSLSRKNDQEGVPAVSSNFHGKKPNHGSEVLQQKMLVSAHAARPGISKEILYGWSNRKNSSITKENLRGRPGAIPENASEAAGSLQAVHGFTHARAAVGEAQEPEPSSSGNGSQAARPWREWHRPNGGGNKADGIGSRCGLELSGKNRHESRERLSNVLQAGRGDSFTEVRCGGGWELSQDGGSRSEGREEGSILVGDWVDSVEIHEQENPEGHGECEAGIDVYNLQVEGHPSYSVNGFLVHNCMMGAGFLSAFSNLNKNSDFRACVLGNPNDPNDCLGRCAEPEDGWESHMNPEKTTTWKTRFMSGVCVNLIGTDSPNFDYPESQPTRYKYLISRQKIAETVSFFGKDSYEYFSQCVGSMRIGQLARRVITRRLCEENLATEHNVNWLDGIRVRVAGLDSAYNGDRCVFYRAEFGKAVGGKTILYLHQPVVIPITPTGAEPEQQISEFVKRECEAHGIPPENFAHDSTGRGSLGTFLARVWSAQTNPIEFGGQPTDRPVSLDHYFTDPKTKIRRLKTEKEHYSKRVSALWFAVRYCIEAGQLRGLTEETMEEGCMREWNRVANDKLELEGKDDMKLRVGRSPDLMDACSIVVEMARRRGFQISKLANQEEQDASTDWLNNLRKEQRKIQESHALTFS